MKNDSGKFNKIFLSKIAIFVFIGAFGISVFAQSTRTMTPVDRRKEQINRQIQRSERDNMTREMKGKNRKTVDSKQSQAIKTQIKKDFEALHDVLHQGLGPKLTNA